MNWRIYYDGGRVFTSEDGTPWDAPRTGVQIIVQEHDRVGWEILNSADEYYYEADKRGWYEAKGFTFYEHLIRAKRPLIVFGRMVSNAEYSALLTQVKADLPKPKTGQLRTERDGWQD